MILESQFTCILTKECLIRQFVALNSLPAPITPDFCESTPPEIRGNKSWLHLTKCRRIFHIEQIWKQAIYPYSPLKSNNELIAVSTRVLVWYLNMFISEVEKPFANWVLRQIVSWGISELAHWLWLLEWMLSTTGLRVRNWKISRFRGIIGSGNMINELYYCWAGCGAPYIAERSVAIWQWVRGRGGCKVICYLSASLWVLDWWFSTSGLGYPTIAQGLRRR